MDYSFLDDPGAISEILASAEPEHRAMQRARRWNHKTLALHIATNRHRESVLRDEKAHAQEEKPVFVSTFLPFCPVSFWSQLVYGCVRVETRFYLFHGTRSLREVLGRYAPVTAAAVLTLRNLGSPWSLRSRYGRDCIDT